MIQTGERATSCMEYLRSDKTRAKFWELMNTGDIATERPSHGKGKPNYIQQERINTETEQAFERYVNGEPLKEIAKDIKVNINSLYARFRNRGLKKNDYAKSKAERIRELGKKSMSLQEIAYEVGVSPSYVGQVLRLEKKK